MPTATPDSFIPQNPKTAFVVAKRKANAEKSEFRAGPAATNVATCEQASTQGCLLRIEKVDNSEDARLKKSISFPVYIVVITKLSKPIDTAESFIEVVPSKMVSPPVQCKGAIDIKAIMSQDRELQYFVAICATQKLSTEHLLQLHSGITGNLRFEIIVVDDLDVEVPKTYAVFIVPADRNNEYLFDCIEGRMALLKDLQYDRLTIIRLQDEEYYESLDSVKNELNALAFCLRPRACEDDHVQMLSIGPTFTKKMIVAKGEGINGPWEVLHVQQANGECFRQLVFTRVANLVQSEARIIENFDNPEETVIDTKTLTCSYQQTMLGSILFLELFRNQSDEQLEANLCVLGLGGGSLTTFLHDTFPKSTITAVDIDKETFDIAKQYFGLPNNSPRVDVILEDAMVFLEEVSAGQRVKKPFDVVFLDISGDHHVDGLVCPTPEFAIRMVFQLVKECMAPNGVLAVNVVSRNMTSRQNVMREFQGVFESSFMFSHDTDLNVVLFGTDQPEAKKTLTINGISHLADSKWIKVKPHGVTSFPKDL
ncbi:hypothetical protein L596_005601 [Steinernema carpocapsae]|uniref:PABS domain-containing protein n=1 Tax=Steinernema carpocapsae TaxID=34508 RepID=A0A4U8UZJ4_STECR|nr:hypothetical protein L596_005601 [Steinernema carpocapsae]